MSEPFLGSIIMVGFPFAPRGWALCNGQMLSISTNSALFALLGVTYGGNGQTTFALPNLQGRVPIHPGNGPGLSPYSLGQLGGSETNTLSINQMPVHNHTLRTVASDGNDSIPDGSYPAIVKDGTVSANAYSAAAPDAAFGPQAISPMGGSQPFGNIQPYLAVNFIIALEGIFPSRN